jgi:hypothetical protein
MRKNKISQAGEPASVSLQSQTNPPHRILVVNHDPYICHLSAEVLIRNGYEVNAAEELRIIKDFRGTAKVYPLVRVLLV